MNTNSSKVIDFTSQCWGHALHGSSMYAKKAESCIERAKDKLKKRRRYTVMCHSSSWPEKGDSIRYKVKSGTIEAKIVSVKPCWNPRDMFTLEIVVTP